MADFFANSKAGDGPGLAMRAVLLSWSGPSRLFSLARTLWAVEKPDPWQSSRLLGPLLHGTQRAPGLKSNHR